MNHSKLTELKNTPSLYQLEEHILNTPFNKETLQTAYKHIFSCLDITTLDGNDTPEKVKKLCKKILSYQLKDNPPLYPASVCVFPTLVSSAYGILNGTPVKIASVAGNFPYGQTPLSAKLLETAYALDKGADEIDLVANRSFLLEGKTSAFTQEIRSIKALCGNKTLKVILETGAIETLFKVREAVKQAIEAGADFVKTSTGKIPQGATPEDVIIMIDEIYRQEKKNQNQNMPNRHKIGIKISGGISEPHQALIYYRLFHHYFPQTLILKDRFRIGCSRLSDNLFSVI